MKRMISKSNRALAAALVMALTTILATAQAPKPSSKGLVIKGKAPISKEVLKVKLPKAYETKLSNGLQVIVLEQRLTGIFQRRPDDVVVTLGVDRHPRVDGPPRQCRRRS